MVFRMKKNGLIEELRGVVRMYRNYRIRNRFGVCDKNKEFILDNKLYEYLYKKKKTGGWCPNQAGHEAGVCL